MANTILARADALMNRRHQSADPDDVPILTDTVEEGDIPVLHEAETPLEPLPTSAPLLAEASDEAFGEVSPAIESPPPASTAEMALHDRLISELTRRIEQRLIAELPKLIETTVRDVLAEQEMIARQHEARG